MVKIQEIVYKGFSLHIQRDDLLHPYISGNKFRKLKYNLVELRDKNVKGFITFGGAFSNHILASAAAGYEFGFETIGIIRGEELIGDYQLNPTLKKASEFGMKFEFISREKYKERNDLNYQMELLSKYNNFKIIPEGGTNEFAIKGCEEILDNSAGIYDFICCAVGTGGTISGIINSSNSRQKILGFPALKGDFLNQEITKFANKKNWELIHTYHFGGYGKIKEELICFINNFYATYHIPLDPIYTGKMIFGIFDLIDKGYFNKKSKILVIHTGGLQGIHGINEILISKNKEIIKINE